MSGFKCGMCGKVYVGDGQAFECEYCDLEEWGRRAFGALKLTREMLRETGKESTHLGVLVAELLEVKLPEDEFLLTRRR